MTKKLEDLFDLPEVNTSNDMTAQEAIAVAEAEKQQIIEIDDTIDKIDAALPTVKDMSASDTEMDTLAKMATEKFSDLMDLGMNVEPRHSSEIFSVASTLLGHAITAKNAKMDKKLRIVQLQIQKARLDLQEKKFRQELDPDDGEEAQELDRNALLAQILDSNKSDDDKTPDQDK